MTINADQIRKVSAQFDESGTTAGSLILAAALAGDGLKFTTAEGAMGVEPADFAGTGLEDDGSDNLQIDTGSTVNFSADTPVWTFGNETTGEGLFITGTPVDGTHAVNKTYVDNVATGLQWLEPADCDDFFGNATIATINGLTPVAGNCYVATDAGTPTAGTSDALVAGSVAEYDGTSWQEIVAGVGGFVADGTRLVIATGSAVLVAPLTDGSDESKVAVYDGTSLSPASLVTPVDGDALLINGEDAQNENIAFVYDGTVPSGSWIQFTGAGAINAGDGLTQSGNTINFVTADASLTVNANDAAVNLDSTTAVSTEASVLKLNANGIAVGVDNSTIVASGAGGSLQVATGGITGTQLASDSVGVAELDFEWEIEDILASAFSFSATISTFTLLNGASITDASIDDNFVLLRNGIDDQTRIATTTATDEWSLSGSSLAVHDDITASGDTYRLRYIKAHP